MGSISKRDGNRETSRRDDLGRGAEARGEVPPPFGEAQPGDPLFVGIDLGDRKSVV